MYDIYLRVTVKKSAGRGQFKKVHKGVQLGQKTRKSLSKEQNLGRFERLP